MDDNIVRYSGQVLNFTDHCEAMEDAIRAVLSGEANDDGMLKEWATGLETAMDLAYNCLAIDVGCRPSNNMESRLP